MLPLAGVTRKAMSDFAQQDQTAEPLSVFGPRKGYSPQIGLLVSQLNWMRRVVLSRLQNLSVEELDWLPHPDANSIGALLMHLAAADVYYGLNTFDGVPLGPVLLRHAEEMGCGDKSRSHCASSLQRALTWTTI